MRIIPMSVETMSPILVEHDLLKHIGVIAGECYNSSKDDAACIKRALNCIKRGHHSPWEHFNITMKCTVDRGTSHALVRHRHCAFQQSSTIYQKFNDVIVIGDESKISEHTKQLYLACEIEYKRLLEAGQAPSEARDVLPTNLATNLIITTNFREWMYMLQRRCGPGDSDKMHEWDKLMHDWFMTNYPQITSAFECWYAEHPL